MCSLGKIFLAQDFQMAAVGCHKNLDAARQINCAASSLGNFFKNHKHLKHKNAHGDCDAAIAKAAAAMTHVQSLSEEAGSGDEGLGLFGFDLSPAQTGFGSWERSRRRDRNLYMASTWGRGLQKKLEYLSAAPDELDHACRDARLRLPFPCFACHISDHHGSGQARVFSMYPRRCWLCLLGSRAKIHTFQGRHRRFVGDSASHTDFGLAPLLVGDTAEVVSPHATAFDSR